ncbi:hypothetical protein GA0115260_116941, partial [Streptomyces sp. MnatMP-M27]
MNESLNEYPHQHPDDHPHEHQILNPATEEVIATVPAATP